MTIRLARFEPMSPEMEAAMLDNLRCRFRAALQAQEGFVSGYWARGDDGTWISFSLWETREAMDRGGREANAVPLKPHQRSELIPSPASVELYEVVERG